MPTDDGNVRPVRSIATPDGGASSATAQLGLRISDAVATRVAIALGSNVGDREAHFHHAIDRLRTLLTDVRVSPFLETEPQDVSPQPRFLNGALVAVSRLAARPLLAALLDVERERGRERPYRGAPRTLDLDLILFGASVIETPDLHVPHPRFRERRFVLEPLAAVGPEMVDPVTGRTVRQLLEQLTAREEEAGRSGETT